LNKNSLTDVTINYELVNELRILMNLGGKERYSNICNGAVKGEEEETKKAGETPLFYIQLYNLEAGNLCSAE
jgi:hypothetical protein